MTAYELDDMMDKLDHALRHIGAAIGELEQLDQVKFIDVDAYINGLYDLAADLELEQASLENEECTDAD